ncbi:hypothetical protein GXW82_28435 [Streptacidiphilus sp. 4-A2]|nr:hypothetical protein [Streptacidiphilus sp. 4-A2]
MIARPRGGEQSHARISEHPGRGPEPAGRPGRALRIAQRRLGGGLDVRRVRTDLDHLRESLALLSEAVAQRAAADSVHEVVEIEDTPYDPEMWRGIDDEGIGCRHA